MLLSTIASMSFAEDGVTMNPADRELTIFFDIKKFGLTVGESSLIAKKARLNNRDAILIVFTAKAPQFYDEEKIFLDSNTYLPMIVLRDINLFGTKEIIREEYDQNKYELKIIKQVKNRTIENVIKSHAPIENIYGFIYRYMHSGKFEKGESLNLNLPTKNVQMKLTKKDELRLKTIASGKKTFQAYYFESQPKQFKIWFQDRPIHVPLRIDGSLGFGKTYMVMKSVRGHQTW